MLETARLHIQGQDADTVRVVGLTGGSVRIGRGPACDVRLAAPEVAVEECRLRRRGDSWQLVPARSATSLRLDGRPVDVPRLIAYGISFQIGGLSLTLHPPSTAAPWGHSTPAAAPTAPMAPSVTGTELADRRQADWQARPEVHDHWLQTHRETKRWESRFRAAGAKLRASEARPAGVPDPSPRPSPSSPVTLAERPRRVDVPREPLSRPADFRPRASTPLPAPSSSRLAPVPLLNAVPKARAPVPSTVAEPLPPMARPASPPRAHIKEPVAVALPRVVVRTAPVPPPVEPPTIGEVILTAAPAVEIEVVAEPIASIPPCDEPDFFEDDDEDGAAEAMTGRRMLGATRRVARDEWRPRVQKPVEVVELEETAPEVVVEGPRETVGAAEPRGGGASAWGTKSGLGGWSYQAPFVTDTNLGATTSPFRSSPGRASSKTRTSPRSTRAGDHELRAAMDVGVDRSSVGRPAAEASGRQGDSREWPTVSDILAARGGQIQPSRPTTTTMKLSARPVPTVAQEPGQWRLPLWLGWIPASAAALGVGVIGMAAASTWSRDGYHAGIISRKLAANEKNAKPLPDGVVPGAGRWWETTAPHLIQWAAYLDKFADDPARAEEVRAILFHAAQASPLNPTVRHALARGLPGETPSAEQKLARGLGQSRDVLTLTWAGRRLLEAGHKRPALEAYRAALAMAAVVDPARTDPPTFLEDVQPRRYAVPTEERLAAVIRDMAESNAWTYEEWSPALPGGTAAALAAARVLREKSSPAADLALEAVVAQADAEAKPPLPPIDALAESPANAEFVAPAPEQAVRFAAGAAALAMKQRWAEARDGYRRAIDRMPIESVRRAWWVNVADLSLRLNEDADRRVALDAAKNGDPKDEITRRAVDLQKSSGFIAQRTTRRDSALPQPPRP